VGGIDIIREESVDVSKRVRSDVFKGVKWVWEIKNTKLLDIIRLSVRKWVDSVENFAQYVARRLQSYGIVLEIDSNLYPISDGYMLSLAFRIRGVREDVLESKKRLLKVYFRGASKSSRKYKRAEELLMRVEGSEREVGDSSPRTDSEEIEEEGGGVEDGCQ